MPIVKVYTTVYAPWQEGEDEPREIRSDSDSTDFDTLTEAAGWLQREGFSAETSDARWLNASYENPYTGEREERTAHLDETGSVAEHTLSVAVLNSAVGGPSQIVTLPADDSGYRHDFIQGYAQALIWQAGGTPSDWHTPGQWWALEAFDEASQTQIMDDCDAFLESNGAELWHAQTAHAYGPDSAGSDFALTRNRHGAGFWDRGMGELGDRLTAMAKPYGSADVEIGEESCSLL